MKIFIFVFCLFYSSISFSWYQPYGWGGFGPYGGYPMGAYGAMGYGWAIPAPSFNYNTVIQQSPPIIINNNEQGIPLPPQQNYQQPYNNCYNCRR